MLDEIYKLCNEKGYFTCGSNEQYRKMCELVSACVSVHDVALAIWICSDNGELKIIESEIAQILER